MRRPMILACACLLAAFTSVALAADAQTKTGKIKTVDATAKSFTLEREGKPLLTFKVDDQTTYTLDGKASTFDAAVKADLSTTVTYTTSADKVRTASKVESTSPAAVK